MRLVQSISFDLADGETRDFQYSAFGARGAYITCFTSANQTRLRVFDSPPSAFGSLIVMDTIPLNGIEDAPSWVLFGLQGGRLTFNNPNVGTIHVHVDFYDSAPDHPSGEWVIQANTETFPPGGGSDSLILIQGDIANTLAITLQCTAAGSADVRVGDANNFAFVSSITLLTNPGAATLSTQSTALTTTSRATTIDIVSTDLANPNTFTWLFRALVM